MRTSLAYFDTTKHDQALMFLLESCLEQAVEKVYKQEAQSILYYYKNISNQSQDSINSKLYNRENYFLNLSSKVKRKNELGFVLQSFNGFPREESTVFEHTLTFPENLDW